MLEQLHVAYLAYTDDLHNEVVSASKDDCAVKFCDSQRTAYNIQLLGFKSNNH